MILGNEVMVLLLGAAVLVFIVKSRYPLKRLPASMIIVAAFYVLLAGWILTVAEGFLWKGPLNLLEHICYAANSLLLCVWCWKATGKEEGRQ